jgi:glycosyltransferase involved in cell wall biosynthesis
MKYSIITVNFNNKEGLRKTIESVIHQTYRDFEYIVIDGGSTDGSTDILKEFDSHIDYWVSEPDDGIYQGMNKGIKKATGDYLNFMNSGDCFYDSKRLELVDNSHFTTDIIVGSDYHYDPIKGQGYTTILPPRMNMYALYKGSFPHQSAFFRRELFNDCLYDESLRMVSDWKFFIQKIIIENCSVSFFRDKVCQRDQKDGICSIYPDILKKETETILEELLPEKIRGDYDIFAKIDNSTFYKLQSICEHPKLLRHLTFFVKIIYKLYNCFKHHQ